MPNVKELMPQQRKVVEFLRSRGSMGAYNWELARLPCLNYRARLDELRGLGYVIDTVWGRKGLVRYVLRKGPSGATRRRP